MIDPDFDPLEDLENCKLAIHELGNAIHSLVEANNVQAKALKRSQQRQDALARRIEALQEQINQCS